MSISRTFMQVAALSLLFSTGTPYKSYSSKGDSVLDKPISPEIDNKYLKKAEERRQKQRAKKLKQLKNNNEVK